MEERHAVQCRLAVDDGQRFSLFRSVMVKIGRHRPIYADRPPLLTRNWRWVSWSVTDTSAASFRNSFRTGLAALQRLEPLTQIYRDGAFGDGSLFAKTLSMSRRDSSQLPPTVAEFTGRSSDPRPARARSSEKGSLRVGPARRGLTRPGSPGSEPRR
jgi:hypothetical protein